MMTDEKKEMKKEYVAPRMEILSYDVQTALLECSPGDPCEVIIE